jgi:hypothetical protein
MLENKYHLVVIMGSIPGWHVLEIEKKSCEHIIDNGGRTQ